MPPARQSTRWDPNPEEPSIRRWRENLRRGSVATGDAWFRALRRFCAESRISAQDVLKLKPKALRDLFMDFAAADERRGAGGSYTAYTLKVAKNWLRFNGVTPPAGVKVKAADAVFEETALSPEQLRAALNAATQRASVAMVLMAQGGIRPEVIGSFEGTDGLRFRDLPELFIEGRTVRVSKTPMVVVVRAELSKATHRYITFLGAEGTRIISDFAQSRVSSGENLGPDSAVFPPERPDLSKRSFVRTTKIGSIIRHAFRTAGLPNRPYVLRTTAASRFAEAENRGLVPHSFWQHWMGHSGDMSARYSVNRGRVPQSLVEEMRAAYKRCEKHLASVPSSADADEGVNKVLKALLVARGMSEADAAKLDLTEKSEDELKAIFGKFLAAANGRRTQRVVAVAEVRGLVEEGWEFVSRLDDREAVLRSPEGPVGVPPPTLGPRAPPT